MHLIEKTSYGNTYIETLTLYDIADMVQNSNQDSDNQL